MGAAAPKFWVDLEGFWEGSGRILEIVGASARYVETMVFDIPCFVAIWWPWTQFRASWEGSGRIWELKILHMSLKIA